MTNRKPDVAALTPAPSAPATRVPSFDLNDPALQAIIAQAVAAALAAQKAAEPPKSSGKSEQMEALAIRAFKKAGFTDVKPRENVLTYNKWIEQGRKVKEGEKAIKVKNLRLFHITQTEPISDAEKGKLLAAKAAKVTEKQAPVAQPAPVQTAPAAPVKPPKGKAKAGGAYQPQA